MNTRRQDTNPEYTAMILNEWLDEISPFGGTAADLLAPLNRHTLRSQAEQNGVEPADLLAAAKLAAKAGR